MRPIDADKLKDCFGNSHTGPTCDDCKIRAYDCLYYDYSLRDICIAIDEMETVDAEPQWIPVKWRELDAEEREYYGDKYTCMADCKLPDDGDEILISRNNGLWVSIVEFCNDDYITDSDGNDWVNDVDAWMPLPKGYRVTK